MYSINKIGIGDIEKIKDVWDYLAEGPEMTYFQKFDWYKLFDKITPVNRNIDANYWIVYKDQSPVLLAPLWILRKNYHIVNRKRIRIIGNHGYTDYVNLIYRDFDSEAFDYLYEEVTNEYGQLDWYFNEIKEDTSLYQYIKSRFADNLKEEKANICPTLILPISVDDYNHLLSKNTRQNIRTAKNRAIKDGIELSFDFNDSCLDRNKCQQLREKRNNQRKDKDTLSTTFSFKALVRKHLINRLAIRFPSFSPLTEDLSSKIISVSDANTDILLAFFNIGYDLNRKEIVVMTAGVDPDYFRYSPGLLLMHEFICHLIEKDEIERIDFTRGAEPYKLQLGASPNQNYNLVIKNSKD